MRRNFLPMALALVLVPATVALVLRRMPGPDRSVLAFPDPTHRVALAVDEVLRADMATVVPSGESYMVDQTMRKPNGQFPTIDEVTLPANSRSFWITLRNTQAKPSRMILLAMEFQCKGRDGRSAVVSIRDDPFAEGCLVDCHGDPAFAKALSGRVADRLAHPLRKHDSAEDRAALVAYFQKPGYTFNGFAMPMPPGGVPAPITPPSKLATGDPAVDRATATAPGPVDPGPDPE